MVRRHSLGPAARKRLESGSSRSDPSGDGVDDRESTLPPPAYPPCRARWPIPLGGSRSPGAAASPADHVFPMLIWGVTLRALNDGGGPKQWRLRPATPVVPAA